MQPQLLRRGGKLPKKEVCFSGLSLGLSSSGVKQQLGEMGYRGPSGEVARFLASKVHCPGEGQACDCSREV